MTRTLLPLSAVGKNRVLVRCPRQAGFADRPRSEAGSDACSSWKQFTKIGAEEVRNWLDVFTGDMIYVAGGTVHTLGPGSVIVETQQQSDTTYRLYDYGRPRELHLKDGLAAVKEKVKSGKVLRPAPEQTGNNRHASLIAAPYFVVDMFEAKDPIQLQTQAIQEKVPYRYWWQWRAPVWSRRQVCRRSRWQREMRWWFRLA